MENESNASKLAECLFPVVFANDDTISGDEIKMIEKPVLADGEVDDEERKILSNIFVRSSKEHLDQHTKNEIEQFRKKYNI